MTVASRLPRLLGVVGSGQMGTGIAQARRRRAPGGHRAGAPPPRRSRPSTLSPQVAATKGINVLLVDADDRALERARANLSRALDRAVARGLDADTGKGLDRAGADAAMARVTMADNLEVGRGGWRQFSSSPRPVLAHAHPAPPASPCTPPILLWKPRPRTKP